MIYRDRRILFIVIAIAIHIQIVKISQRVMINNYKMIKINKCFNHGLKSKYRNICLIERKIIIERNNRLMKLQKSSKIKNLINIIKI